MSEEKKNHLLDTSTLTALDTQTLSALHLTQGRVEVSTPAAMDPGERFNQHIGVLQLPEKFTPYEPVKLLLPDDVSPAEVEALAVSLWEDAGWLSLGKLRLHAQAYLSGPWTLEAPQRAKLGAGRHYNLAFSLFCPRQRSGVLPEVMRGMHPISDAFELSQPCGLELDILNGLYSIARRLGGIVWVPPQSLNTLEAADDASVSPSRKAVDRFGEMIGYVGAVHRPQLVAPDPDSNVNISLYAPIWLQKEQVQALLENVLGQLEDPTSLEEGSSPRLSRQAQRIARQTEEYLRETFGVQRLTELRKEAAQLAGQPPVGDTEPAFAGLGEQFILSSVRKDVGEILVSGALTDDVPLALRFESWSHPVCARYDFVWIDAPAAYKKLGREERLTRLAAARLIETGILVLREVTGGEAVDEDQFLVL